MPPIHALPVDRRALLRSAMLLVGGSVVGIPTNLFAQEAGAAPRFFGQSEYKLLHEIAGIIMPATDTPGAREAGVPGAIDSLMADWAAPATQQEMRALLAAMATAMDNAAGGPFLGAPAPRRAELFAAWDAAQFAAGNSAYVRMKELILTTYYLSEAGATQELRYELSPGVWDGWVAIDANTPAWAV